MKEILYYTKPNNKSPLKEWLKSLDNSIRIKIIKRINRMADGNYGDWKTLTNTELAELRIMTNKGYRIYFKELDNVLILLLAGGDKSTQKKDIEKASLYYQDFIERLYGEQNGQ